MRCRWARCEYVCAKSVYLFVCMRVFVAHIVSCRIVLSGCLDGVGQEAEDGADPQQDGESTKQLATELDPLRGGGRRGESIGTVPDQELCCLGIGQSLEGTQWDEELAKRGEPKNTHLFKFVKSRTFL